MSNQQGTPQTAQALPPLSTFDPLNTMYVPRQPYASRERALPVRRSAQVREQSQFGPDAIWGHYNNYRSNGLVGSAVVHVVLLALLLSGAIFGHQVVTKVQQQETVTLIAPSPDSYALPVAKKVVSGGGGGGDHDVLQAPKGRLPKLAMQQITPPSIILRNPHPKLAVEPTVVIPPQVRMAENNMPNLGIPSAAAMPSAPPSNGTGSGAGIGSGSGGGVGVGHGAGVGAGSGGGIGGGVFKVGGGISAPQPLSTPDPEYTEQARIAKTQGTCILWLIVDDQGRPRDIRVVRGLGMGLDAKAIEAVKQWKFQPSMKDGRPVSVQISVEVGFKLY
ncbi:MAG: energy transducer TonB [Candidatus Sulfotelmatobacter sp.]